MDIVKIRNDNKLLTVEQRSKYILVKNAYKLYKNDKLCFSERSLNFKRPNLCAPTHRAFQAFHTIHDSTYGTKRLGSL